MSDVRGIHVFISERLDTFYALSILDHRDDLFLAGLELATDWRHDPTRIRRGGDPPSRVRTT